MNTTACVGEEWLEEKPAVCRLGIREKRMFFFTLSRLLKGGLDIRKSLMLMVRDAASGNIKAMLLQISADIQEGKALSSAMSRHTGVFTVYQCRLASAGEVSGRLEDVLSAVAEELGKEESARAVIRGAVAYPLFIFALGVATFLFLVYFTIPRLSDVYRDFGQTLPPLTAAVIRFSQWMRGGIPAMAAAGVILYYLRNKIAWPKLPFLRLPLWGELIKTGKTARFAGILSLLLKSGIPALEALTLAADTAQDQNLKREILEAGQAVSRGRGFAESLAALSFMDRTAAALMACGEESGRIGESLEEIAELGSADMEALSKLILKLAEPVLIVGIGAFIGLVVIAMLFPIATMSAAVR